MILKNLMEGGIYFMLPIYIMWIVVVVLIITIAYQAFAGTKESRVLLKKNNLMLFLGSFAFLIGVLGQTIGLMNAFEAIQQAGDISPALIFGGISISMLAPMYGFVLFILSFLFWFINKNNWIKN